MTTPLLVTGGTGSLGQAVVTGFLKNQQSVIATWNEQKPTLIHPQLTWIQWGAGDLKQTQTLAALCEQRAPLSGWIHLTGAFWGGMSFEMTTPDKLARMMQLNFESASQLVPVIVPVLGGHPHASIVFIGGEAGLKPSPGFGSYGVSKAALLYLTETLSMELKGRGITVNAIIPSTIDTPANRKSMPETNPDNWVTPDSIATVIRFLISPAGESVNGSFIRMNR